MTIEAGQRRGVSEGDPLERLREVIGRHERLLVAYSGGVDSALVATVGSDVLGERCIAVTAVSPSLPASERAAAKDFARSKGIRHLEISTDEFDNPDYVANRGNRCYFCKDALFDALTPLSEMLQAPMALGTNLDDLGDHRPGLAAAKLRGSIAPLVEAGLGKAAVREVSARLGLATAGKPAAACLSSRVAYGDPVTREAVARIEAAEAVLHDLGFAECRVRSHADGTVARIEVPAARVAEAVAVRAEIDERLRRCGFTFVTVDLAGFASGRMNALLPLLATDRPAKAVR